MRETPYAGRVKPSAEASGLFTHSVFQAVVVRKTASSECILQGAKDMKLEGVSNLDCWSDQEE